MDLAMRYIKFGLMLTLFAFLLATLDMLFINQPQAQYSISNYHKEGGAEWVVGGTLDTVAGGVQNVTGTLNITHDGILKKNGLILEPTTIVATGIAGSTKQIDWPGLDSDDKIIAGLTEPVTCSLYAAKANLGHATFYFSAAIQNATIAAIAVED